MAFAYFLFLFEAPYSKHNVKTKTGCNHFILVAALHLVITDSQWQQVHPGILQLSDSVDSVADDDLNDVMLIAGAVCSSFLDDAGCPWRRLHTQHTDLVQQEAASAM